MSGNRQEPEIPSGGFIMPVIAAIGAQWGDEGKGKVIDMLAEKADIRTLCSGVAGATAIRPL